MRKSCYSCVLKHLGSAAVFIKETKMGYPDYDIYVIGELEHAADESIEENRDLAEAIREHRIAWTEDHGHMIPFEAINRYIKCCILAEKSDIGHLKVPDDVLEGIKNEDGSMIIHGDTRP